VRRTARQMHQCHRIIATRRSSMRP
jgi:hypothetical protein